MSIDQPEERTSESPPVLVVENLQQRLLDPGSGEQFTVTVDGRLAIVPGTCAAILGPERLRQDHIAVGARPAAATLRSTSRRLLPDGGTRQ